MIPHRVRHAIQHTRQNQPDYCLPSRRAAVLCPFHALLAQLLTQLPPLAVQDQPRLPVLCRPTTLRPELDNVLPCWPSAGSTVLGAVILGALACRRTRSPFLLSVDILTLLRTASANIPRLPIRIFDHRAGQLHTDLSQRFQFCCLVRPLELAHAGCATCRIHRTESSTHVKRGRAEPTVERGVLKRLEQRLDSEGAALALF
mmetsp:Transcript_55891/g.131005  ORF Transcript_55891/g.131005 Transcript_55891/m.131005 type:complete len:202 (-) Transcript_55891:2491-3096(-)